MKGPYENVKGFTLVEVLASLVILSIVLIGTMNLMLFANNTATTNNDKLVAINIGKATIERIKITPFQFIPKSKFPTGKEWVTFNINTCEREIKHPNCKLLFKPYINDTGYNINLKIKQDINERNMELINVIVKVQSEDEKVNHKVEGYVSLYGK